jgi:uncharacterized repeat protein (TIGR01451 family)
MSKRPTIQYIQPGDTATFTIVVTNTGDITLTTVVISDTLTPGCDNTVFTELAPDGESDSTTCTQTGVTESFTNTALATGTTELGEQSQATAQAYVDAELPDRPTLISPPDQSYTNTTNVRFSWSDSAEAVTYTLNVSGSLYSILAPSTMTTTTLPGDGVYTWTVQAIDAHGRPSSYTDAWQITVDTEPPSPPLLLLPPHSEVISDTATPTFRWEGSTDTLSGPVTYTIIITGAGGTTTATSAITEFTPSGNLSSGVYTWTVQAHDRAGNVAASSQVFTFTLERQVGDVYLPIIIKDFVAEPDLAPIDLIVEYSGPLQPTTPVVLGVVLQNQGTGTAAANFWVDFYINPPAGLPTTAGTLWSDVSGDYCGDPCYGLAWQVRQSVAPGQVITLTSTGEFSDYLQDDYTEWPGSFNSSGTQRLGTYVDSWNGADPNGFIPESNETNNAFRLIEVGVSGTAAGPLDSSEAEERSIPPRSLPQR